MFRGRSCMKKWNGNNIPKGLTKYVLGYKAKNDQNQETRIKIVHYYVLYILLLAQQWKALRNSLQTESGAISIFWNKV